MNKLKIALGYLNSKFNIVGWSWYGAMLFMCILAIAIPTLEYKHKYYQGPSISYDHNYQLALWALLISNIFYMFFRFWLIRKYKKNRMVLNPTWDMVFTGALLLAIQVQLFIDMNVEVG